MLRELRTRFVDDDLRGVHAQALLDDGDGDKVEMMAECLIHSEQEAVPLVQKFGNAVLVEKGFDTFGKYPSVTDLRRFIQHLHEEFLVLTAYLCCSRRSASVMVWSQVLYSLSTQSCTSVRVG